MVQERAGKLSLIPAMFDGISANDNVNNLLDGLAKGYSNFERDKIYNLTGDKGMNLVAIDKDWALSQPGKQLPIFIESAAKDTLGHGMGQVLDSSCGYFIYWQVWINVSRLCH